MPEVFIARQPIYDRQLRVVGYELLFRQGTDADVGSLDKKASAQSIVNSLIEVGLDRLVGNKPAFVNLSRELLLCPHIRSIPANRVIFEILEDIQPDDETIAAINDLARAGYAIALDDFIYRESMNVFLSCSRIVKIDVLSMSKSKMVEHVNAIKQPGIKLLAEKVESQAMLNFCKELGFDLFQGFFFCKPQVMKGVGLPANRLALLTLLARIQDPHMTLAELEQIISQDVALTYKLLRLINSAAFGMRQEVESLRQALLLLGMQTVSGFASLILMAGMTAKPQELMTMAMVRGRMCELIARGLNKLDTGKYSMTGLLSVLDAMLDMPMEAALARLPLTGEVKAALTRKDTSSDLAQVLGWALAYERGEFEKFDLAQPLQNLIADSYLKSVEWTRDTIPSIAA